VADLMLQLGVKTDPTEYRFSFPWLFRLLADKAFDATENRGGMKVIVHSHG
jgi:hypothetical protein